MPESRKLKREGVIMYKVPYIRICPIFDIEQKNVGIQYKDYSFVFDEVHAIDNFLDNIDNIIDEKTSIILYRQDVKKFANLLAKQECEDKIQNFFNSRGKEIFKEIKDYLRTNYTVLKLRYDPRTQQYCGPKTAFIIHKSTYKMTYGEE